MNLPKTSIYLFLKTAADKKNYRTFGPVSKQKLPDRREIYRMRSVGPVPISLTVAVHALFNNLLVRWCGCKWTGKTIEHYTWTQITVQNHSKMSVSSWAVLFRAIPVKIPLFLDQEKSKVLAKTLTIYDSYCRKIFRVTTVIVVFRKNIIL